MYRPTRSSVRIRQQGQTLIIALIIMGVLLILGLVFLGILNRNLLNAARTQRRSEAQDLATAGVSYAHAQLVSSPLGADWRGTPTPPAPSATNPAVTFDPDAYYTRPRSGLVLANGQADLGGPDGMGPFVRLPFQGGRSLTRVRYGATDATLVNTLPGGPLRQPGAARSTLIIESIGRPGAINPNDPTTVNAAGGLQYRGFADAAALTNGINALAQANAQIPTSRRLVAFAQIGIIDAARFVTNSFNTSTPIDLGIPQGLGASYQESNNPAALVENSLTMLLGTPGSSVSPGRVVPRGQGRIIVNGDLRLFGRNEVYLNRALGDSIQVAGSISGADGAQLTIHPSDVDPAGNFIALGDIVLTDGGATSLNSRDPQYSTALGLLLDGVARQDAGGFARGVGQLVPPSMQAIDPQTKMNRYVSITRESGVDVAGSNTGRYGHGSGVYVDNTVDKQQSNDSSGRLIVGSQRSIFDDWLNPNSGQPDSGWKGQYYMPRGAVMQLLPNGFSIQRDGSAPASERTWLDVNGNDSGLTTLRFRIGRATDGTVRIADTLTVPNINAATINFDNLPRFNGVLYFEGNVRVRGTIPTNVQLTLVSNATIYIEGSILKGIVNNDVTLGPPNAVISGASTSSLMLMAKDNVAVNTSMFFGPLASQAVEEVNDTVGATGISPVRLRSAGGSGSGQLGILFDLAYDSNNGATLARNYQAAVPSQDGSLAAGNALASRLLITHTMDDALTVPASFLRMDVNYGFGTSTYAFNAVDPDGLITNSAAAYLGLGGGTTPLYGLGAEPWQRYSRFESRSFDLLNPAVSSEVNGTINQTGVTYSLLSGQNDLLFTPGSLSGVATNDLLIGRTAVVPSDIKIEASIFAEQGCFFVIPGNWFNPNPNDTRAAWSVQATTSVAQANRYRLENYGNAPSVPFYGEPLDVRVNIIGSIAENLPPPIAVQAEWIKKWGWIPRHSGANASIPLSHVPAGANIANENSFVPNLVIQYDPVLATGRVNDGVASPIRTDAELRPLAPMPRLPVSPKLAYFGEL